jgi:hypothetical protein
MAIRTGGARRIDRVLAADFLADLRSRPLCEVRGLRNEAEQEESDHSYTRRLIHGRIDILRAEQRRRSGAAGSIVEQLPKILAEGGRGASHGLGRRSAVEPTRFDAHDRYADALATDMRFSDLGERTDTELADILATLTAEEKFISTQRRAVQQVMDTCNAEIARRYRDGEAEVDDLLRDSPTN